MDLIEIQNLSDHELVSHFCFRKESELVPYGEIVIDSEKVVLRAIQCGVTLKAILATEKYYKNNEIVLSSLDSCLFFKANHKTMEEIVGHRIHQGMIAIARRPAYVPLNELKPPFVVFNKILDASNIGGIIRNCHAFGVQSLIFDKESCSPYTRRSIRVSMGSVFNLHHYFSDDLVKDLSILKGQQTQVLAAGLWETSQNLNEISLDKRNWALIVGNEDQGIHPQIQELADIRVKIPIENSINSLNVTSANAVLLYALCNQSRSKQ